MDARLDAGDVFACAGVHPNDIADVDEVRALDLNSGLRSHFLGDAGGGIPTNSHFRFHDLQIHRGGQFDVYRLPIVECEFYLHALLQEYRALAERLPTYGWLIEGFTIHEIKQIAILIQVGNIVIIQPHILNGKTGIECPFDVCARKQISRLYPNGCVAATGFVMAVIQNFIDISVQLESNALPQFIYIDHACISLVG